MEQSRITVTRTSPDDVGLREIYVDLDGERLTILQPGDSVTRQIPPGRHRIRVHNTLFWKTVDVVLQPDEHALFSAVNRPGWGTYSVLALLGAGPLYLTFERTPNAQSL
jgi:hypothetical protein